MDSWDKELKEKIEWYRSMEERLVRIMPNNWTLCRVPDEDINRASKWIEFHPWANDERDAPKIICRCDLDDKKFVFSASWPKDLEGKTHEPGNEVRVGVSFQKTDAQIRADLDRRFWPLYTEQWRVVDAIRNTANVRITTQRKLFREISVSLDYRPGLQEENSYTLTRCGRYGISDVRIWSNGQMEITTESLPVEDALKVIELLKSLRPKKSY